MGRNHESLDLDPADVEKAQLQSLAFLSSDQGATVQALWLSQEQVEGRGTQWCMIGTCDRAILPVP